MKNIEVGYCVRRDGNVILQDVALVKITDRQIPEIAKYILSDVEYQTGELVCVPSKIYDRITSSVYEDAISKLGKRKDALYGDDEVELEEFLPDSLLKLLPEEVVAVLPFESNLEDEESDVEEEKCVKKGCELPEPDNSNTLYLVIKQVYFDQIIAGTKTEEYREIKETTYKRYIETGDDGSVMFSDAISDEELSKYSVVDDLNIYNNGVCPLIPKNWCYLNLAVGYNKKRDTALVEVVDITFEAETDKSGNVVRFDFDESDNVCFSPTGKLCLWIAVLHLGKVVRKEIVSK
jgi:hypothetical protein